MKREHLAGAITVSVPVDGGTTEEVSEVIGYVLLQQDEKGNLRALASHVLGIEPRRFVAALAEVTANRAREL